MSFNKYSLFVAENLEKEGDAQLKRIKRGKNHRTFHHEGSKVIRIAIFKLHRSNRLLSLYRMAFWVFLAAYIVGFLLAKLT